MGSQITSVTLCLGLLFWSPLLLLLSFLLLDSTVLLPSFSPPLATQSFPSSLSLTSIHYTSYKTKSQKGRNLLKTTMSM